MRGGGLAPPNFRTSFGICPSVVQRDCPVRGILYSHCFDSAATARRASTRSLTSVNPSASLRMSGKFAIYLRRNRRTVLSRFNHETNASSAARRIATGARARRARIQAFSKATPPPPGSRQISRRSYPALIGLSINVEWRLVIIISETRSRVTRRRRRVSRDKYARSLCVSAPSSCCNTRFRIESLIP